MLFFYINMSPGNGGRWWLAPLLTLAFSLGTSVVSELLSARWYADRGQQHRARLQQQLLEQQRRRQQQRLAVQEESGLVLDFIDVVLILVLIGLIVKLIQTVRQRGGLRAALASLRQQQQAGGGAQRQQQQQQQRPPRPDFDRVVAALQRLPTDVVATREELEKEPAHELKQRLTKLGIECHGCVEKGELVEKLLDAAGGSSSEACAICAEEYVPGDVVRVLPCRHRLHIECIDRWLLKSTEHSAPKGCPLCNDERWLTAGAPAH